MEIVHTTRMGLHLNSVGTIFFEWEEEKDTVEVKFTPENESTGSWSFRQQFTMVSEKTYKVGKDFARTAWNGLTSDGWIVL